MSNAEIARNLYAAWEKGNLDQTASLLAGDFALTGPAPVPLNKEAFLVFQKVHNEAFAIWSFNPHDFREEGDTVECTCNITATQTGTYDVRPLGIPVEPIPPSGVSPVWPEEKMTFTIRDGRISALNVIAQGDGAGVLGTLKQLGVALPAPAR